MAEPESYSHLMGTPMDVEDHPSNNVPRRTISISEADYQSALQNGREASTQRELENLRDTKTAADLKAGIDFDTKAAQSVSNRFRSK